MTSDNDYKTLSEILLARSKINPTSRDRALKVQKTTQTNSEAPEKLSSILTRLGMISGRDVLETLSLQRGWSKRIPGTASNGTHNFAALHS